MQPAQFWATLGRHGARLYGGGSGFVGWASDRSFANLTGEPNLDLNIACLYGEATEADAESLLAIIDRVNAPTVVPVSPTVAPTVGRCLKAAGFVAVEATEAAMWRPPVPVQVKGASSFTVRRAESATDLAAAGRVLADAHGTAPDVIERVFGLDELQAGTISCWIAWDGDEPASTAWLTVGDGFVGVWEMMTSPRYRRRGAARAALTTGLAALAAETPEGAFLWASPDGRPLYVGLGFEVVEETTAWVRGGTAEELALIGAVLPS